MTQRWDQLKVELRKLADSHSPQLDSFLYNGGTAAVIAATGAATLIPTDGSVASWVPKVLTGFAAIWVGISRALNFGARWSYHRGMRAGYLSIISMIDFYLALDDSWPDERRREMEDQIKQQIEAMYAREGAIPGAEAALSTGAR